MDHETLQALIDVYRVRASSDLLTIILDEAEGPQAQAAVLDLLRSLSNEQLADDKLAPARRKACQFSLKAEDFVLAERLAKIADLPEDKIMRVRALHGLCREGEAIAMYRQATQDDPATRNRDLERLLGIRPTPSLVSTPAKIIPLTTYSARREPKGETERRETAAAEALLEDLEAGAVSFPDVFGLEDIKAEIRRRMILPYLKPSLFERFKQKAGGSLLLYGPPGCGKTLIARATAGESDARFLTVTSEDVVDRFPGEAEKRLRVFFDEARSEPPAILFFDDFDIIARHRSNRSAQGLPLLTSVLISEIDAIQRNNRGILIIAATNAPLDIDPAFFRAGRFQRVMFTPPPDPETRKKLLLHAFQGVPGSEKLVLDRIVKRTDGFSCADLKALADAVCAELLTKSLAGAHDIVVTLARIEERLKHFDPSSREWSLAFNAKLRILAKDPHASQRVLNSLHC